MNADSQLTFCTVELPTGGVVELVLPARSVDPVVNAYKSGSSLNHYLTDWLLRFTGPGDYVVDFGCHVGTLSVPAAALGRHVLAVDASPLHVACVRESARRNRLSLLQVEWCAVAETTGELAFNENGLWGSVVRDAPPNHVGLRVPGRRGDELIRDSGWPKVDLVKMDVEGSELAAMSSLGSLLIGEEAPVVVYESNGMTFEIFGYGISEVRKYLERLGYLTCRMEGDQLVYCPPDQLQPEAWLDVIALPPKWQRNIRVVPTWPREDIVRRCVEWGTNEHVNVRKYVYHALAGRYDFPRDDLRICRLRLELEREFGLLP